MQFTRLIYPNYRDGHISVSFSAQPSRCHALPNEAIGLFQEGSRALPCSHSRSGRVLPRPPAIRNHTATTRAFLPPKQSSVSVLRGGRRQQIVASYHQPNPLQLRYPAPSSPKASQVSGSALFPAKSYPHNGRKCSFASPFSAPPFGFRPQELHYNRS